MTELSIKRAVRLVGKPKGLSQVGELLVLTKDSNNNVLMLKQNEDVLVTSYLEGVKCYEEMNYATYDKIWKKYHRVVYQGDAPLTDTSGGEVPTFSSDRSWEPILKDNENRRLYTTRFPEVDNEVLCGVLHPLGDEPVKLEVKDMDLIVTLPSGQRFFSLMYRAPDMPEVVVNARLIYESLRMDTDFRFSLSNDLSRCPVIIYNGSVMHYILKRQPFYTAVSHKVELSVPIPKDPTY